ncbi:MAG: hypothetical protein EXR72_02610 [Myxococcales bacterium]|nr:hypothetical protein [Myxococcales bacterium]
MRLLACLLLPSLIGCSGSPSEAPDLALAPDLSMTASPDLAESPDLAMAGPLKDRPYMAKVPSGYDAAKPTPLLILLHGFGASGAIQNSYFEMSALVDKRGFLYAYPDGTLDQQAMPQRFWNGTDACCDFFATGVDDVAYLGAVIDDMSAKYNVDKKRIFVAGHSNGGFMAHRLACDLSPRIAGIVSLAGAGWKDPKLCPGKEPVAVLQVHGDADDKIGYGGGSTNRAYPSARDSVGGWVTRNGCKATAEKGTALDLDGSLAGAETIVERWTGCKGGAAELWTIQGGGHIPKFGSLHPDQTKGLAFAEAIYGFLAAHPKP